MSSPLAFTLEEKEIKNRFDVGFYHSPLVDEFFEIAGNNSVKLVPFKNYILKLKRYPLFYGIPYLSDGVPCLKGESIDEDGNIDRLKLSFIPEYIHMKFPDTWLLRGDLVFSVRGTIGKVAVVEEDLVGANISANLIRVHLDKKKINPHFIKYFLLSKYGQAQINQFSSGSLQYTITESDIKNIMIPDIKYEMQNQMVDRIKTIENKGQEYLKNYTENIKRLNTLLNKFLKIDFPEKSRNYYTLSPDRIKDRLDCYYLSPNHWELRRLLNEKVDKNLFELKYGKDLINGKNSVKKKDINNISIKKFKYIEVKHTDDDLAEIKGFVDDFFINLPSRARQYIKVFDVLLPRPVGSTKAIGIVPKELDGEICSTGFLVFHTGSYDESLLLWIVLKSDILQKQFFYTQSGSIQPEISPKNFDKILIPIPQKEIHTEILEEGKKLISEAKDSISKYQEYRKESKRVFLNLIFG